MTTSDAGVADTSEGVSVGRAVAVGVGEKLEAEGIAVSVGTGEAASAKELTDRMFREIMGTYSSARITPNKRTPIRIRGNICT